MLRRWTLLAVPLDHPDPNVRALSRSLAEAANADPDAFWTKRGAWRAGCFHAGMLPLGMVPVLRTEHAALVAEYAGEQP
jgi:hypothetical protein